MEIPNLLYADDLVVLCGESEEDLRAMMGRFVELYRRRGLKVNVGNTKVMVMNGEEGLEYEAHGDRFRLGYVWEFKYLWCVLDESGTDGTGCSRKVGSGRRVTGAIRSLVKDRDLQIERARVLHETLLVPVLTYRSETLLWKEKERS